MPKIGIDNHKIYKSLTAFFLGGGNKFCNLIGSHEYTY